ncbi:MAG TPA: type II toxin-antitoxin system HicA family toxin [Thermoanaerobaculia bacterium]|nr:type II toxin-antitoxin system HicA family toxin [Thermoanaerobaculia bacterium]
MVRPEKLLEQLLSGRADRNIAFEPLCQLLRSLGFRERINGDHHIFGKEGVVDIINLQPLRDGKAKPYQVKQVRNVVVRYKLAT